MDSKITKRNENKVLGREEIEVVVYFDKSTPSRKEIKAGVCAKIGANPDGVVIRSIRSMFGAREVSAVLHVYADKGKAAAGEPNYVLVRDGMAEKKPKKEKKKAAPPEKKK